MPAVHETEAAGNLGDRRKRAAAGPRLPDMTRQMEGLMSDKKTPDDRPSRNEGEGNKTAARAYNEAQQRFVRSGKVEKKAREAEDALARDKRELERAEAVGKSHGAGEDPAITRKP
jgi:hypothetical protein